IAETGDPELRVPQPKADDEVSELALTLDAMLHSLAASRQETELALARQRQFVADASHELRTPLTSILANLELLADTLPSRQGDAPRTARRAANRARPRAARCGRRGGCAACSPPCCCSRARTPSASCRTSPPTSGRWSS